MKYEFLQSRFTEGVLAQSLQGRSNEEFYQYGLKGAKNIIPLMEGACMKRPGTIYTGQAKTADVIASGAYTSISRFVKFFKDTSNAYVIEIGYSGGAYMRLWSQDQLLNNKAASVTIYENTSHPWTAEQISNLKWTQSGDVIFFTCPTIKPYKLSRTLNTSGTGATYAADGSKWDFTEFVMEDGPYNSPNIYDKDDVEKKWTLKFNTEPSVPVTVANVQFNTLDNSFVLASHGMQIGQKVDLTAATASDWGNLVESNSIDWATINAIVTAGSYPSIDDARNANKDAQIAAQVRIVNLTGYYVISATATTFQVSATDGGSVKEFALRTNKDKSEATVTLKRYVYEKNTTTARQLNVLKSGTATAGKFVASDIGRLIRINPLAKPDSNKGGIRWAWAIITDASVSDNHIEVKFYSECSNTRGTLGTSEFRLGVFSDGEGWPQVAQIYQQRMVLAASTIHPSSVWLSRTSDFYSFSPTELSIQDSPTVMAGGVATEVITDSNAISFTIDSDTLDEIKWIAESKKLMLGTSAGIYMLYGSETNLALTPFRFTINRESSFSATNIEPVVISNALIYSQIGGKELQELLFQGSEDQWFSSKISMKGYDLIRDTAIIKMVWQERPHNILWMQMSDGRLLSLSYNRQLKFHAWSEHLLGGTNALVQDIEIISKAGHDQLWIKVKRDNHTLPYVEILSHYTSENILARKQMIFVDSSVTDTAVSTTAVSGLSHLDGDVATIYYDGMEHAPKTVASGALTLDYTTGTTTAVVGLSYDSEIDTLSPTPPDNQFSYTKRLLTLALEIQESLGIKVEYNSLTEEILFRSTQDNMGEQISLFTGKRKLSLSGIGWDIHTIKIKSDGPFPMQINALAIEVETGGI